MTKAVYNISQLLTDWSWELFCRSDYCVLCETRSQAVSRI